MWQDPILQEIYATRERISNAYGNDLHAIVVAAQRGDLSRGRTSGFEKSEQPAKAFFGMLKKYARPYDETAVTQAAYEHYKNKYKGQPTSRVETF